MKAIQNFFKIFTFFLITLSMVFSVSGIASADDKKEETKKEIIKPVVQFKPPASEDLYPSVARPNGSNSGAGETIASIIAYGIGLTAILAVIAVTWAGIQMFLSVGDDSKFSKARELLIYALVGVGLSGMAYLIVRVISGLNF